MVQSKAIVNATLVLRILALGLSVASFVVFITNTVDNGDGTKSTFKDIFAFRYTFSTAFIGAAYSLLQLPFAVNHVATGKRLIKGDFLPVFDFYADKVISFLVASGVGAGFAVTFELKRLFEGAEPLVGLNDFFVKGYVSAGLLLGAFLCFALLSVIFLSQPENFLLNRNPTVVDRLID